MKLEMEKNIAGKVTKVQKNKEGRFQVVLLIKSGEWVKRNKKTAEGKIDQINTSIKKNLISAN